MNAQTETTRRVAGRGFTLAEVMIVIAIIVILIGIGAYGLSRAHASGRIAQTRATINTLDGIVDEYLVQTGKLPTIPAGAPIGDFLALVEPFDTCRTMLGGLHAAYDARDANPHNHTIVDGWKHPIRILQAGSESTRPVFQSLGDNGTDDGGVFNPNGTQDDLISGGKP